MVYDIIQCLADTSSLKEKEAILKKNASNEILKRVFKLTYSQRIKFHVRKYGKIEQKSEKLTLVNALDFLEDKLATRTLTGNAAIEALVTVMENLSHKDCETIRRIINRDLECGVGRSIPNTVWPGLLPTQPQYLCNPYSLKNISYIKYPAIAQLKADGARCFAEVVDGEVYFYTRSGSEYYGLDSLKNEILKIAKGLGNISIDGELVYFPKRVKSGLDLFFDDSEAEPVDVDSGDVAAREIGNGIVNKSIQGTITSDEAECLRFQVWDLIDYDVTIGKKPSTVPYEDRLNELEKIVKGSSRIEVIEWHEVKSLDEAKAFYRKLVAMKREGIVLKNKKGLWEDKRGKDQVKFKEERDFDGRIIDAYPHKKDPNKLGGVIIQSEDGLIQCRVGSGFKDKDYEKIKGSKEKVYIPLDQRHELDRELLWDKHMKGELVGSLIYGVCNAAQKVEGRDTYSLFLPRVKGIRHDKNVANTFFEIFGEEPQDYFK